MKEKLIRFLLLVLFSAIGVQVYARHDYLEVDDRTYTVIYENSQPTGNVRLIGFAADYTGGFTVPVEFDYYDDIEQEPFITW